MLEKKGGKNTNHERTQVKAALRESEQHFRVLAESSPDMIWVTDTEGELAFVNRACLEFIGVSHDEIKGVDWRTLVHPDDGGYLEAFRRALQERSPFIAEARIKRADGEWRWIASHGMPWFSEQGEFLGHVGSSPDITERKRAEEAMRESEQRFASFMFHLPAAAWMKHLDGRYVYANVGAERIFGTPLPVLIGKTDYEIFPSETARAFVENDRRVLAEGGGIITTEALLQPDGIEHYSIVSKFAVPGLDGRPAHLAGVAFDITDRKRAEEALRESEAKFSKAFQAAPALFSISSLADGRYIDVNEELVSTLGFEREELIGHTAPELGIWETPGDRDRLRAMLQDNGKVRNFLTRFRSKSGSIILGHVSTEIIEIKGEKCLLTLTRDVTELRRAEEERTRMALMVESSDDAIIGKTLDGIITSWNRGAEKIYGYSAEEIKGKSISILVPPGHHDDVSQILDQLRRGERIEHFETRRITKDGRVIPVSLTISPIMDDNSNVVGASTIARDISDQKRAEQEIEALNRQLTAHAFELEAVNQELEAFTYSASHDLRQPLNIIGGYSQLISKRCGEKLDDQCVGYQQEIYNASIRMDNLIDALLKFSRATRTELHRETVDLSGLARSICEQLRIAEPGREVDVRIADGITANGDSKLLRVVLDNILGNAWKFTSHQEQAVIDFGTAEMEGEEVYFVRDNGAGFDMGYAGKLFIPFQRLHSAADFEGHGIGLATVEKIIRRHGGRVWAEGEPGKGATFFFTLPSRGNSENIDS